jgi:5,10-methylenetetrahydromethanopterin reductase
VRTVPQPRIPGALRHGLVFAGGGIALRDLVALASAAETAGFDSVLTVEAWRSGTVPLAAIAAATERIGVGTYVLNAHLRTPLLAGLTALDLDELSSGRVTMAVGTGNPHMNSVWHGLDTSRPAATMEEYVRLLRSIVSTEVGSAVEHRGAFFRCSWSPAAAPTRQSIPIHLAGMYPKMQTVAGKVADGLALAAFCSAQYVDQVVRPQVTAGAESVGRDPTEVQLIGAVLTRVDEDGEAARSAMRRTVCHLLAPPPHPYYDHVLKEQGEDALARRISALVRDDRVETAMELIPDEFLDRYTVAGSPEYSRGLLDSYRGVLDEAVITNAAGVDATLGRAGDESPVALLESYRSLLTLPVTNRDGVS